MELLDKYFDLQKEVHGYFGYTENWRVIPLDDATEYFWRIEDYDSSVLFADTEEELESQDGNYYSNEIYTQRHLEKHIYRGKDYTMICVDTHTDGNQFLQVFSNKLER